MADIISPDSKIEWPRITLVTPSFNHGSYIGETIESVLAQGYPNLEYIVVDGGSTDGTQAILERYSDRLAWWVSELDGGQGHALNKGFARATGEILGWLNSDDRLAPEALKSVALAFRRTGADLVAGICEVYQDDQLVHRHLTANPDGPLDLEALLDLDNGWNAGQFFYQPEVFFSREIWDRAGAAVDPSLYYSMDYELWLRFALRGARLHGIGATVAWFRAHAAQKTADERGFKSELVAVRDAFAHKHGLQCRTRRPPVNWTRRLRVVMLNDLGARYGAGAAHLRIAAALDLAGHEVEFFMLTASSQAGQGFGDIIDSIQRYAPDLIICGNLHAAGCTGPELLRRLTVAPIFWLTHDFWLLTGRCAYMGECPKYLKGCDAQCPTPNEYPALAPEQIHSAWSDKVGYLRTASNLTVLANSRWSQQRFRQALQAISSPVEVEQISLGAPTEQFRALDRQAERERLGIAPDAFAVAFSVSSLSDARKGGAILKAALARLGDFDDLALLLIGNTDVPVDFEQIPVHRFGYVTDPEKLISILNAADIFVGPSTEETFGQVFVEAALCGVPSVGFETSGVRDAIVEGFTGVRIGQMTPEALAAAIRELRDKPEKLSIFRELAPLTARSMFSLEASYRSLFLALDQCGLIDRLGLPHKISLSRQSRLLHNLQSRTQAGFRVRLTRSLREAAVWLIGKLPPSLTGRVRRALPKWIEVRVVQWLIGRDLV